MHRLKVMVVDDDETTLEVTSAILEQRGYDVVKRNSALGTTMAILRERPEVVLLDVHMPGLNGDRLAELVSPRRAKHSPIVVLHSGDTRIELEQLAARCGAAAIIEKTGDPFEFIRRFERVVAQYRHILRQDAGTPR